MSSGRRGRVKVFVLVGVSLDGFLAREDGDLDWMHGPAGSDAGDHGYDDFIKRIDALVMGRGTFEKALTFDRWPYGNMPVFVLTSKRGSGFCPAHRRTSSPRFHSAAISAYTSMAAGRSRRSWPMASWMS